MFNQEGSNRREGTSMRAVVVGLIFSLTVGGCKDLATLQNNALTSTTDRNSYAINQKITFLISNGSKETIYLPTCCVQLAYYIDRYQNGAWSQFDSVQIPCWRLCPSADIILSPNQPYADSIRLSRPGFYRLRYEYGLGPFAQIDREFTSNQFTVQ